MGRLHLFEWEDQPWFPSVIRDAGTAYLRFSVEWSGAGRALAETVGELLERSGSPRVVDLCSGGGGPLLAIAESLREAGAEVDITLTDLYPDHSQLEAQAGRLPGRARVHGDPVDARAVPAQLSGVRTLFSAFHHFRPDDARGILRSAVASRQPLAAVEVVARHPLALLGMLFAPLATMLALPFLRPFRWEWIPLTYLVPVIPAFVMWDGVVSCLRCYRKDELLALAAEAGGSNYHWEVRELPLPGVPVPATVLLGWPDSAD